MFREDGLQLSEIKSNVFMGDFRGCLCSFFFAQQAGNTHAKSTMVAEARPAGQGRDGLQCFAQTEIVLAWTFNP